MAMDNPEQLAAAAALRKQTNARKITINHCRGFSSDADLSCQLL